MHTAASIWGVIPHCVVWTIWREQNNRIFEGEELSIIELKRIFILSLFEWITTLMVFPYLLCWIFKIYLVLYNALFPIVHSLCTWVTAFFVVTIKKKKSVKFLFTDQKKKKKEDGTELLRPNIKDHS